MRQRGQLPDGVEPGPEGHDGDGKGDACDLDSVAKIKLNVTTSAAKGTAGVTSVAVIGGPFPAAAVNPTKVDILIAKNCMAQDAVKTQGTKIDTVLGSTKRVFFTIPQGLSGTYKVWLKTTEAGGFESSNCSTLQMSRRRHSAEVLPPGRRVASRRTKPPKEEPS